MSADRSLTSNIKATLRYRFNHAAGYRTENGKKVAVLRFHFGVNWGIPYLGFSEPPVVFEKAHGMKGLSARYILPAGLLPRELQEYAMVLNLKRDFEQATPFDRQRMRKVWDRLAKDNPKTLGRLNIDTGNPGQIYHAILGAASAFKPRDIQFWLDGGNRLTLRQDPVTGGLMRKIEARLGHIGWAPCPATLRSIERKMTKKFKAAANQNNAPPAGPAPLPPRGQGRDFRR